MRNPSPISSRASILETNAPTTNKEQIAPMPRGLMAMPLLRAG